MSISAVSGSLASQNPMSSSSASQRITPQQVSTAVLKQATGDGDARTGAAALNDGDAASMQARRSVNIKA
jgi:hypothetical protein